MYLNIQNNFTVYEIAVVVENDRIKFIILENYHFLIIRAQVFIDVKVAVIIKKTVITGNLFLHYLKLIQTLWDSV